MTTTPEESDPVGDLADDPIVGPLFRQSAEQERAVLNEILTAGVDQGWLLRARPDQLITDTTLLDRVLARIADRPPIQPDQEDPWREVMPPAPEDLGDDPAYAVLSQRCDLIRPYCLEPVIELAPARRVIDKGEARQAKLNSTRLIAIGSDERSLYAVEMRSRTWLPKHLLFDVPIGHAVILDPVDHKRFRHRLGGRYWRDAVPDDLREAFAEPLRKAFSKGARNKLLRHFSMLLGQRIGDRILVLAVIGPESEEDAAYQDWEQAVDELERIAAEARGMMHEDSGPVSEEDLSVAQWLEVFKFEFDDLSYGSKVAEGHARPPM
jgi:hypothetical protein